MKEVYLISIKKHMFELCIGFNSKEEADKCMFFLDSENETDLNSTKIMKFSVFDNFEQFKNRLEESFLDLI